MKTIAIVILTIVVCATGAWAGGVGEAVEVRIVTDGGRTLPTYPLKTTHGVHRVYAEAIKGDHYRINVKNRLNRRVGLVVAVDGRNIISGAKSWLKSSERMYILEPYGSGEYAGWRTAQDRVNRFYFTDLPDSYAAAFGDESAMGVIVVAVYPEAQRCETSTPPSRMAPAAPHGEEGKGADSAEKAQTAPAARPERDRPANEKTARARQALQSAGTGYGRGEYSPAHVVAFEPESRAVETIYLKYEWRSTLCKLAVVACAKPPRRNPNRFWDDAGYAPPPPPGMRR